MRTDSSRVDRAGPDPAFKAFNSATGTAGSEAIACGARHDHVVLENLSTQIKRTGPGLDKKRDTYPMSRLPFLAWIGLSVALATVGSPAAASPRGLCAAVALEGIPERRTRALAGSAVTQEVLNLGGAERDAVLADQVLSGNIPAFLRDLSPVTFSGQTAGGREVEVTICVTPDYLAVGEDRDFVRIPLGLPTAARIADLLGVLLPTPRMVDAIYQQAGLRFSPSPMQPTNQMSSTGYFWQHDQTIDGQRTSQGGRSEDLMAGHKKDLVLSTRLRSARGRVAIYGWHRANGRPIQPLSTVHGAEYADYSHGIRLISTAAFVDGRPYPLSDLLQNAALASMLSGEGPITDPRGLQASLYR